MKDRYCFKCKTLCEWLVIEERANCTYVEAMCPVCLRQPNEYWTEEKEQAPIHNARTLWLEIQGMKRATKQI